MRKNNSRMVFLILFLILSIGIGYSYITSELNVLGNVIVKKYISTKDLYAEIVNKNKENGVRVLDSQSSMYVSSASGINFDGAPGVTNGQGIYIRKGTENDTYPIYYYRGEVNNNIVFGDFCWKIVRTTETGGIKLIYNGIPIEEYETIPIELNQYTNITNDATHEYVYNESTKQWSSTNRTDNDTGTIIFSVAERGNYTLNYDVSSEMGYDEALFYLDGTLLGTYSGVEQGSISLGEIDSTNVIKVEYTKDTSMGEGDDMVKFNVAVKTGEPIKSCGNTGTNSQIGKSMYNSTDNYNAHIGYMYGTPNSSTYAAEHLSTKSSTSSTIKTYIDNWYSNNMTNYTSYLEDTIWCNDRTIVTDPDDGTTGTGSGTSRTSYGGAIRLTTDISTPSLACTNQNDRFTVNSTMTGRLAGNAALTYPVALITADEATLAGHGWNGSSSSSYLANGESWWTMTPISFFGTWGDTFSIYKNGSLSSDTGMDYQMGVRPSISLKNGTQISKKGDGSPTSPYVVE